MIHWDYYLYYFSYLSSLFNGYPFIIRMTVIMVTILLILTVISFIRLFFIGYKKRRNDKRRKLIQDRFQEHFEFLLEHTDTYDDDEVIGLIDFDPKKAKKWECEEITVLLLDARDRAEKENQLNLGNYRSILSAMGIIDFWEKQVKGTGINKRKHAIRKLENINSGLNGGLLSKSIYHKDSNLRKLARNIYTSQDGYDPFKFMEENFDEDFNQLDEVRLHATFVKYHDDGHLPNLLRWIGHSRNDEYIAFMIKEIGYFKQESATEPLLQMLDKYDNKDIKIQIIRTLGELEYSQAIPHMLSRYEMEVSSVRRAIIEVFSHLRSDESLSFLKEEYLRTEDRTLKMEIVQSVAKYDDGQYALQELSKHSKENEQAIIEQVYHSIK